jgi:hypothetical protein
MTVPCDTVLADRAFRRFTRVTAYELLDCLIGRLLELCQDAERRTGTDDDLQILFDIALDGAEAGNEFSAIAAMFWKRSWRFRLCWFLDGWLAFTRWSKIPFEVKAFEQVALTSRRLKGYGRSYRHARDEAARGRDDQVAHLREAVVQSLWQHLGDCLHRAGRRR